MNPSTAQATVLVDELIRCGVRHVVACPGSRNAPLTFALHAADVAGRLTLHVRIDERAAGFLALGLAAGSGVPVALSCTSGTAAANFHPAVAEADRARIGLVVLTADRPPELRAAGANQVIDQHRLYGNAPRHFAELATAEHRAGQNGYWRASVHRALLAAVDGPVQLNLPFRAPLVPDPGGDWPEPLHGRPDGGPWGGVQPVPPAGAQAATPPAGAELRPESRRGLVLLAPGPHTPPGVPDWARRHGWPVLSETGGAGVDALASGPWLLGDPDFLAAHRPSQVLCVGRPTVFRQVERLLADTDTEVLLLDPAGTSAANPSHTVRQFGGSLGAPRGNADPEWLAAWRRADAAATAALREFQAGQGWNTGTNVAGTLLDALPTGATLTVGSSNPTRNVALAARSRPDIRVHRNRGAAGIDGTLSTAAGMSLAAGRGYALVGDLTFLHDLNGLLRGPAEPDPDLTIVVHNDGGGGIFSLLEQGAPEHASAFERIFGTPHGADLGALCAGYHVPHTLVRSAAELHRAIANTDHSGPRVLEVRAGRDELADTHAAAAAAVTAALRAEEASG